MCGIDETLNFLANSLFLSTSISSTVKSGISFANLWSNGFNYLHGGHHVALKSAITSNFPSMLG